MSNRWLKTITNSHKDAAEVSVPKGYRTTKAWVPTIGDIIPNFSSHSTKGDLNLFDFAEGQWTFIMNQPFANGAVCTTEVATLAHAKQEFTSRNCSVLSVTQESVDGEARWIEDIERYFNATVWFPMVADPDFEISDLFGMTHWRQREANAVRKTFLIDPSLRVSAITEYPLRVGRSVTEMLRILDAQILSRAQSVVTPCDWKRGDPALVPHNLTDDEAYAKFGDEVECVAPNVRIIGPETLRA